MEIERNVKILIVEDDQNLGFIIADYFQSKGFEASFFTNATEAYNNFKQNEPDLCLFDVILPDKSGFELAKDIRKVNHSIPIIFLTAQSMKEDVLTGFSLGADDYIRKPFIMDELWMRVSAVLKRALNLTANVSVTTTQNYDFDKFRFDYKFQKLIIGDQEIELTHKENELMKLFCDNPDEIIERDVVLKSIWGNNNFFNSRSMDVYIAKIRKHLSSNDTGAEIINIRGLGFKMRISN